MKLNDLAEEKSKLVVDAYTYALKYKLDIKSHSDVAIILKALDPEHSNDSDVEAFIPVLGIFAKMTRAEVAKRTR